MLNIDKSEVQHPLDGTPEPKQWLSISKAHSEQVGNFYSKIFRVVFRLVAFLLHGLVILYQDGFIGRVFKAIQYVALDKDVFIIDVEVNGQFGWLEVESTPC